MAFTGLFELPEKSFTILQRVRIEENSPTTLEEFEKNRNATPEEETPLASEEKLDQHSEEDEKFQLHKLGATEQPRCRKCRRRFKVRSVTAI